MIKYNKTKKIVMAALMAAMTCIATMIIQVPSPVNGYIHLGDGLVLLSGILLGPVYGGAAAGLGSMFADLLAGYPHYALGTLVIKALAAVVGGLVYHRLTKNKYTLKSNTLIIVIAGIFGGIIVTSGYFLYSFAILSKGILAAASIPGNIVQNIFGIIVSSALMPFLAKAPFVKELIIRKA